MASCMSASMWLLVTSQRDEWFTLAKRTDHQYEWHHTPRHQAIDFLPPWSPWLHSFATRIDILNSRCCVVEWTLPSFSLQIHSYLRRNPWCWRCRPCGMSPKWVQLLSFCCSILSLWIKREGRAWKRWEGCLIQTLVPVEGRRIKMRAAVNFQTHRGEGVGVGVGGGEGLYRLQSKHVLGDK